MTIQAALLQGQKLLEDAQIAAPRLTAEVLLIHAISHERPVDRAWLYAHGADELRQLWWIHYGRYLHERMQGKPTQYITGHQEFYGRDFRVTKDVLIPRPETEHLVEAALSKIASGSRVIDVGTGSGAIAVTLALETGARVVATDISPAAIAVATENARKLEADVAFLVSDLCACFADRSFDMVVSNPPYVPRADEAKIQREVREFEPPLALYGGENGLAIYRRLIPEARRVLKLDGWLMMELGYAVVEPVQEMLAEWNHVEIRSDLAGLPRVVMAQKPQK
jgi:release factor glutamine methyltransferase